MPKCVEKLTLLYELAHGMNVVGDISVVLDTALQKMATYLPMMRGSITLVSQETGDIRIRASYGLNEDEKKRGTYARGEGITGRVIKSGRSIVVSDVSDEPRFLNKTRSRDLKREHITFLCVPIMLNGQVVGALSLDQRMSDATALEEELRLLEIIASILGHAAFESQRLMDVEASRAPRPQGFIGLSSEMDNIYQLINQVANSQATVLLQGESGTGKELAARAIHAQSLRSHAPFISINCAALPLELIESELFGHEKGAFTGANAMHKGRFELADGGTLFLDEIGELPLVTQAKLLRVLQNKSFERVGGSETRRVDVRFISATNRDLVHMVEEGLFRQDLFYRINVFPIALPPLRARQDDILPLCNHFLRQFAAENKHPPIRLSYAAMDLLTAYQWPGNVRELENAMLRSALLLGPGTLIEPCHLPPLIAGFPGGECHLDGEHGEALCQRVQRVERDGMVEALTRTKGHIKHAAGILGLTERVMRFKMKRYGLSYKTFRKLASSSAT
ncbi:MAG: sigma 54-interacting transcriptional regulator [Desulfovibrio sp.]|nr:sigma 54-interacting transcriptional regulator [Desulfovibrio sp.]